MQDRERSLVVADQDGFGDLELQPPRRQPGSGKRAGDLQRQRRAFELNRRNVDG